MRALQCQANTAHTEKRVFFFLDRPVRQRLVAAHVQRTHHQRPSIQAVEHATVLGFLSGLVRCLRVRHENQLGTQQANAFRALLDRSRHTFAFADIGEHFNRMPVLGHGGLMAQRRGGQQALFTAIAFVSRALQSLCIRRHVQATALAVNQQLGARGQQQNRIAGTHQGWNTQGAGDDGTVRSRPASCRQDARDPRWVQTRHIRGAHFVHYQHVRLIGFGQGFDTAQLRQYPSTDVTQVRRTFGQQGVLQ